jgi:S-adenosylmethionine decarboxylase
MIAAAARMRLHAMDVWVRDPAVLTDADDLRSILRDGAHAGATTVLDDAFHVFPNGAVTGVLLLAQSHLSIHTWPELSMANVDLLTYGSAGGDEAMALIRERLGATRSRVRCLVRDGR